MIRRRRAGEGEDPRCLLGDTTAPSGRGRGRESSNRRDDIDRASLRGAGLFVFREGKAVKMRVDSGKTTMAGRIRLTVQGTARCWPRHVASEALKARANAKTVP